MLKRVLNKLPLRGSASVILVLAIVSTPLIPLESVVAFYNVYRDTKRYGTAKAVAKDIFFEGLDDWKAMMSDVTYAIRHGKKRE